MAVFGLDVANGIANVVLADNIFKVIKGKFDEIFFGVDLGELVGEFVFVTNGGVAVLVEVVINFLAGRKFVGSVNRKEAGEKQNESKKHNLFYTRETIDFGYYSCHDVIWHQYFIEDRGRFWIILANVWGDTVTLQP